MIPEKLIACSMTPDNFDTSCGGLHGYVNCISGTDEDRDAIEKMLRDAIVARFNEWPEMRAVLDELRRDSADGYLHKIDTCQCPLCSKTRALLAGLAARESGGTE